MRRHPRRIASTVLLLLLSCALAVARAEEDVSGAFASDAGTSAVDAATAPLRETKRSAPPPVEKPAPAPIVAPAPGPVAAPAHAPATEAAHAGPAAVQIGDRRLCTVRLDRGGETAQARSRRASRVLEQIVEEGGEHEVKVRNEGEVAVVYVGATPIIQLTAEDSAAAGDSALSVHAEECAASVRQGLRTELRRREIANVVFSISLIVLSGLLSFLLMSAVARAAARVRALLDARESLPSLRVGSLDLITPNATRVVLATSISVARPLVQIGIFFGWLISALSLSPVTQPLGLKLSGFIFTPIATLLGRLGAALPLAMLVAVVGFALVLLLRFLDVFFESVAQGGINLRWVTPEQALPARAVARAVAIVAALLATPILTGDSGEWGALRIFGVSLMGAGVLALSPALANSVVGTVLMFGAKLKLDAFVEIGPHTGRLVSLSLTELIIEDRSGASVRVPYLLTLFRPVRVLGDSRPSHYEVTVDARAPQGPIRKALGEALSRQGQAAQVELIEIEGERALYRVIGLVVPGEDDLASAIADALTRGGHGFGRIRKLDVA